MPSHVTRAREEGVTTEVCKSRYVEISEQPNETPQTRIRHNMGSVSLFAGYQILFTQPTLLLLTLRLDASSQLLDIVITICSVLF
jgi:hypothetical protein